LKLSGDILSEFLADAIGSEIVEATVRYVTAKITDYADEKGYGTTKPYSPGYCQWHVREQQSLFSLLPEHPCGIRLNSSCLMHPIKSVSGIVGIGVDVKTAPYGCEICKLKTCYKRKEMK